ncbi:hypothetical protein LI99_20945 [Mycolicibacterium smegmatis]|uniref:Uncharacterized protein n=1 Tax=Mycolicibacterium smegmatis (strain ATCC 700084 / mc(2)155) TaxID=246196 RepID=A0R013_MYCS2|nr:hypothetical protein MSMEG_4224 [Mycolicibacterium smegmatis MC2 155]AIU15942.1 hypothetical protein LI99_20945 [Mycolicibacterium smegmatis]AIU09317.1 hypothetical protein LJ00_20940 [Mycolicibacterium smegmatis MC2 155]AIU22565.1 hypothetical protein LI98_20950 [Mycolicibacterium smegmatis]TBH51344.1 hypothetical protein EYS45_03070 [Mycolicibacterium smegmatis MC2 155]
MRGGHGSSSSLVGCSGRRSPLQTLNLNHRLRVMSSSSAQTER